MLIKYKQEDMDQTFLVEEKKLAYARIVQPSEDVCRVILWYSPAYHEGIVVYEGPVEEGQNIYQRLANILEKKS